MTQEKWFELLKSKNLKPNVAYKINPTEIITNPYGGVTEVAERAVFTLVCDSEECLPGVAFYTSEDNALGNPGYIIFRENRPESSLDKLTYGYLTDGDITPLVEKLNPVLDKDFYKEEILLLKAKLLKYESLLEE